MPLIDRRVYLTPWCVALAACAPALSGPADAPLLSLAEAGVEIEFHGPAAERFLSTSRVVRVVDLGQGITQFGDGSVDTDFWDTWQTEVAAYRIDQMISLHMVPAVVERPIRGQEGSLMWWVDAAMSEEDRVESGVQAPDAQAWNDQIQKVRLYDELIANVDRHMNNLMITEDFDIRLIDHSRAFRTFSGLQKPEQLTRFSRSLLASLERLSFDEVKAEVGRYLSDARIQRMLDRRDAILALVADRIAARGEAAVLYR